MEAENVLMMAAQMEMLVTALHVVARTAWRVGACLEYVQS